MGIQISRYVAVTLVSATADAANACAPAQTTMIPKMMTVLSRTCASAKTKAVLKANQSALQRLAAKLGSKKLAATLTTNFQHLALRFCYGFQLSTTTSTTTTTTSTTTIIITTTIITTTASITEGTAVGCTTILDIFCKLNSLKQISCAITPYTA